MPASALYDYYLGSVKARDKHRCGDAVAVDHAGEPPVFVGIVADGVGSRPCDWLASETVAESIPPVLHASSGSLESRLQQAVLLAHHTLANQSGTCAGMLAGLAMIAWEPGARRVFSITVGDVRIYRITASGMIQISTDDSASELLRVRGKLHLVNGGPVSAKGITKALGQEAPLEVNVETHEFLEGETLVLASDGAYGIGVRPFAEGMAELATHVEIAAAGLSALLEGCSHITSDDASLLLIRRNDVANGDYGPYQHALGSDTGWTQSGLFAHIMARFVSSTLLSNAMSGDVVKAYLCVDYLEAHALIPSPHDLDAILKSIYERCPQEVALFRRVQHILRPQ